MRERGLDLAHPAYLASYIPCLLVRLVIGTEGLEIPANHIHTYVVNPLAQEIGTRRLSTPAG